MKKILYIAIVLLVTIGPIYAQLNEVKTETINGKKFYVHIVEQGNTLYGIHQLYNTSVENILNANEGLTDNLVIGQKVLIPILTSSTDHYGTHIVIEGETLYGISKKYKCTVDDLKLVNKGIEDGIIPGQKIMIPIKDEVNTGEIIQSDPRDMQVEYQLAYRDSIILHTVLSHETMYSISKRYMVTMDTIRVLNDMRNNKIKKGNVLKIPVKKIKYTVIKKDINTVIVPDSLPVINTTINRKETYNVALMLPFMLAKNDVEMNKNLKIGQFRELYPTTKIAFEFYQGFIYAADSLTKAGLKVNIYIYDTRRDTTTIAKFFEKEEFKNMDLVVGPMYNRTISYTVTKCREDQIE